VLLLVVTYVAEFTLGFDVVTVQSISGVSGTVLFLIVSYLVGHLVQTFGREIEALEKRRWGGYFSIQFLRASDKFYSPHFKRRLRTLAQRMFGLPPLDEADDQKCQEMFNLCYSLVAQNNACTHAELHNATYGMLRGILAVWYLIIPLFVVSVVRHSTVAIGSFAGWWDASFSEVGWHLALTLLLSLLGLAAIPFLRNRFAHFGRRFVDAVYRSFYVYAISLAPAISGHAGTGKVPISTSSDRGQPW
jgi:hypothetical protein